MKKILVLMLICVNCYADVGALAWINSINSQNEINLLKQKIDKLQIRIDELEKRCSKK